MAVVDTNLRQIVGGQITLTSETESPQCDIATLKLPLSQIVSLPDGALYESRTGSTRATVSLKNGDTLEVSAEGPIVSGHKITVSAAGSSSAQVRDTTAVAASGAIRIRGQPERNGFVSELVISAIMLTVIGLVAYELSKRKSE